MCATPWGTTRFSRFFLNSFLRFDVFAGACVAASCCGSFAKSVPSIQTRRSPWIIPLPAGPLLPGGDFLFRGDRALPRALARARIGVRALAVNRKIAAMAHPAIALDFDQPPDVHLDLLAEIALDAALGFDRLAQTVNLFLGQVLHLL